MEPLTWTGQLGTFLDPLLLAATVALGTAALLSLVANLLAAPLSDAPQPDGTAAARGGLRNLAETALRLSLLALLVVLLA